MKTRLGYGRPVAALGVLVAGGCRGPALEPGFRSVDPQERTAALLESVRAEDGRSIPDLIAMLESGDPAQRMLAANALRRLTGEDLGYRHYDPPAARAIAADAWRRWWIDQTGAERHATRPADNRDAP